MKGVEIVTVTAETDKKFFDQRNPLHWKRSSRIDLFKSMIHNCKPIIWRWV